MNTNPDTNARFTLMGNGTYSERIADQVQLFYNPTTQAIAATFNNDPYLSFAGSYVKLAGQTDMFRIDMADQVTKTFTAGLDPVTGADLSKVSVAGLMTLLKEVFDYEYNAAAATKQLSTINGLISAATGVGSTAAFTDAVTGLAVTFTDTSTTTPSTDTINAWGWDFGDGVGSSLMQNPTYTYAVAGTYTARLVVTTAAGSSTVSRAVTVA